MYLLLGILYYSKQTLLNTLLKIFSARETVLYISFIRWLICAAEKIKFSTKKTQLSTEKFQVSAKKVQFSVEKFQFSAKKIQLSTENVQLSAEKFLVSKKSISAETFQFSAKKKLKTNFRNQN